MKLKSLLVAATIASATIGLSQDPNRHIRTSINGVPIEFTDVKPMMLNGRVMVPMRDIFTYLGAQLTWNPVEQVVTARQGEDFIWLPIGKTRAQVNGTPVVLDTPAQVIAGRTMVPLRFVSESLGASVQWVSSERLVDITMASTDIRPSWPENPPKEQTDRPTEVTFFEGDVLPFKIDKKLTTMTARRGERFTATLAKTDNSDYAALPAGVKLEGTVSHVSPKQGSTPGVLGLAFDRIRMPNGAVYDVDGELISLDEDSVESKDGRLVAKPEAKSDNLKYVGYGAGAGALIAIVTEGNLLTNSLIGAALGFLYGELQRNPERARDVTLEAGTNFGVRLESPLILRIDKA